MTRPGLPMAASPLPAKSCLIIARRAAPVNPPRAHKFALFAGFARQMRANFVKITPCQMFLGGAIITMFFFAWAALHVVWQNKIAPNISPAVSSGHPCPAIGGKPSVSLRCARGAFVFPGQAPCGGAVPGFLFLPRRESPVLNMLCIFLEEETPWKNSFI